MVNAYSTSRNIQAGDPQGAVMSPTLSNYKNSSSYNQLPPKNCQTITEWTKSPDLKLMLIKSKPSKQKTRYLSICFDKGLTKNLHINQYIN